MNQIELDTEYQEAYFVAVEGAADEIWQSMRRSPDKAPDWQVCAKNRPGGFYWKRGVEEEDFLILEPIDLLKKMRALEKDIHDKKMQEAGPDACPDCYGEGEIGGQFCGGYQTCTECNGTGKKQ